MNKCEQFFRAQQMRHANRVWLASYHLTGTVQQWYIVLEWDADVPEWEDFKRLCHQQFGPPISTNHLADLARLPFTSFVEAYLDAFQARMAHASHLVVPAGVVVHRRSTGHHSCRRGAARPPRPPASHAVGAPTNAATRRPCSPGRPHRPSRPGGPCQCHPRRLCPRAATTRPHPHCRHRHRVPSKPHAG